MENTAGGNATVEAQLPGIARAARAAEVAKAFREEFNTRKLFTQAMADDYSVVANVPLNIVVSAVLSARDADQASTTLVEATAASIAIPVEPEPAPVAATPAVETAPAEADELPQPADEFYAANKPAVVAPTLSLRDQAIARIAAGLRERKATQGQRAASPAPTTEHRAHPPRPDRPVRPARPMRPAPAPKAEYVLGKGEYWCTQCPRRHVTTEPLVPELREIKRIFDHPPTRAELVAIAACEEVLRDERRKPAARQVRWFPLEAQVDVVAHDAAEHAANEAAEGKADRVRTDRRATRAVAGAMPYVPPAPKASSPSKRSKQNCDGFAGALEKMRSKG